MNSVIIRDQVADPLITPKNAALVRIDYQVSQLATVRSMGTDLLLKNIVSTTVKTAKTFGVPIVHSTVNAASRQVGATVPELAALLDGYPSIDRTTANSWEDVDFVAAVRATGRRKLIFARSGRRSAWRSLRWTREGYEVYPVVHATGGDSIEAHRAGLVSRACELQRDWNRQATVPDVVQIVLTERLTKE